MRLFFPQSSLMTHPWFVNTLCTPKPQIDLGQKFSNRLLSLPAHKRCTIDLILTIVLKTEAVSQRSRAMWNTVLAGNSSPSSTLYRQFVSHFVLCTFNSSSAPSLLQLIHLPPQVIVHNSCTTAVCTGNSYPTLFRTDNSRPTSNLCIGNYEHLKSLYR